MSSNESPSKGMLWAGRIVSALPAAALILSGILKLTAGGPDFEKGMAKVGWTTDQVPMLAALELGCTLLYLIPQTSVLGAILITGYMGGACATHVRIHEAPIPQVAIGVLAWLGLWLREPRLHALAPLRR